MARIKITKKVYDQLKKDLEELKTVKRPQLAKAIGEAREHGDLRENSAYHEAKNEQGLNEAKIRDLEAKLNNAEIVEEKDIKKDQVRRGLTVKLKDLGSERELEYTLVSELEADILENKISTDSPLGEALLGAKVGEVVEFEAPRGLMKYKVLRIS